MPNNPEHNPIDTRDVVVIGGGVIGLSVARELALRGARNVTLIERNELGQEASWAAGGIIAPQIEANSADDFFKLACASRDLYPGFAQALRDETGLDIEFNQTGTLYVGFSENDEHELRRRYEWQTTAGFHVEWLTGDQARHLEPIVSAQTSCALRFPDDWQVDNRKLVQALAEANRRLEVHLIQNCEVQSVRIAKGRVTGIETSNGFIDAASIVMAAGAWTSNIVTSATGPSAQIKPVRGQMLCFKTEPPLARHVVYSSRGYLVPRYDGRLLAGSTSEQVGFDKRVTAEGIESIKSMAFEIAPALKTVPVFESWAGFRPHAPDDLPVLGPAADIDGLFYATGHYRNGILLAPVTGTLMAEALINRTTSATLAAFQPGRLAMV